MVPQFGANIAGSAGSLAHQSKKCAPDFKIVRERRKGAVWLKHWGQGGGHSIGPEGKGKTRPRVQGVEPEGKRRGARG